MRVLVLVAMLTTLAGGVLAQPRKAAPRKPGQPPPHLAIERFNRMSPDERDQMLKRLPPERKAAVEQRLERFNKMSPEAKKRLREEFDQFQQLPPEKQETVRKTFRDFNQLPEERQPEVRRELQRLRRMTADERQSRLNSEEFRDKFNAEEQGMLETLSDLLGPE
jgi:hypothetical protein